MIDPPPRSASRKKKRNPSSPRAKSPRQRARSPKGGGTGGRIGRSRQAKPQKQAAPTQYDDDDFLGLNDNADMSTNFSNEQGVPQASGEFTDRLKQAISSDDPDVDDDIFGFNDASPTNKGSLKRTKSAKSPPRGRSKSNKSRVKGRAKSPKEKSIRRTKSPKHQQAPKLIRPTTAPTPGSAFPERSRSPGRAKSPVRTQAKSPGRTQAKSPKPRSHTSPRQRAKSPNRGAQSHPHVSQDIFDDADGDNNDVDDDEEDGDEFDKVQKRRSRSLEDGKREGTDGSEQEDDDGVLEEAEIAQVIAYCKKNLPAGWFQKLSSILESSLTSDRLFRMACKLHIQYQFKNSKSFVRTLKKEFGRTLWDSRLDELMVKFYSVVSEAPDDYSQKKDEKLLLKNATTVDKLKALGISLTYTCSRMDPNCKFRSKEFEEYRVHCESVHRQIIDQGDIQLTKLSIPGVGTTQYEQQQQQQKKSGSKSPTKPSSPTFSFGFKKKKFNW